MKNQQIESGLLVMPIELRHFAIQNVKSSSPYNRYGSGSFYTEEGKTWDFTPEGTIRISDHWNFYSQGKDHCKTDIDNELLIGKWAVGKWDSILQIYQIISIDEKVFDDLQKREERQSNKNYVDQLIIASEKRIVLASKIKAKKEAKARALKIKRGNLWVSLEHNIWTKGGRGHWNLSGVELIVGQLVWESKSGSSIMVKTISGTREFRKYSNYKELKRKPSNKK